MRRIALALAAASVLACTGDPPAAPATPASSASTLPGSYGLSLLNNRALPQVLGQDGIGTVEMLSGTMQLNADATYLDIINFRRRGPSGIEIVADTIRGGYLTYDRTILLQPVTGGNVAFLDIRDANTLSSGAPGFSLLYRR